MHDAAHWARHELIAKAAASRRASCAFEIKAPVERWDRCKKISGADGYATIIPRDKSEQLPYCLMHRRWLYYRKNKVSIRRGHSPMRVPITRADDRAWQKAPPRAATFAGTIRAKNGRGGTFRPEQRLTCFKNCVVETIQTWYRDTLI